VNQLDAIQARADAATEGPWTESYSGSRTIEGADDQIVIDAFNDGIGAGVIEPADAEFITHAREDVPKMVAALRAVEGLVNEWHKDYSEISPLWSTDDPRYIRRDGLDDAAHELTEAIREALGG